jgi:hypothetical protein
MLKVSHSFKLCCRYEMYRDLAGTERMDMMMKKEIPQLSRRSTLYWRLGLEAVADWLVLRRSRMMAS